MNEEKHTQALQIRGASSVQAVGTKKPSHSEPLSSASEKEEKPNTRSIRKAHAEGAHRSNTIHAVRNANA